MEKKEKKWYETISYMIKKPEKKLDSSGEVFKKCKSCNEVIYKEDWNENQHVCPYCGYHFRLSAKQRIEYTIDEGTFQEIDADLRTANPLKFEHNGQDYEKALEALTKKTELKDAIVCGTGEILGEKVIICVMDFSFFGGSLGTVMGEKIVRAINLSIKQKTPLIIFSCTGGARMQEGAISLMQMAKTCSALTKLADEGILYISVLTDPTMGGVSASFASIGDLNISEPNALIGFAGPLVIEQTIKQKLPKGFQRSEFLVEHGFIDFIVLRSEMKNKLHKCIQFFKKN